MLNHVQASLSYPIIYDHHFNFQSISFANFHRVVLIGEADIMALYATSLTQVCSLPVACLTFSGGEQHKTRQTKEELEDALFALGCGRDTLLIALGGGVTLDLVGFLASTYQRGIPVIYCPTSLLAMVDATIGGKTGVNTAYGKNLIGSFYQPLAVMINVSTLASLSNRHYHAGLAEVLKHAIIASQADWIWLQTHCQALLAVDTNLVIEMITRSHQVKTKIVAADFTESGERKILNFGHTFAHALEAYSNYQYLHGEAVALGLLYEAQVSHMLGLLPTLDLIELKLGLSAFGFDDKLKFTLDFAQLTQFMRLDKKNQKGQVHMTLLRGIGQIYHQADAYSFAISEELLYAAYEVLRT